MFKQLDETTLSRMSKAELIELLKGQGEVQPREELDIRADRYIRVMSLVPYKLNLSTQGNGQGRVFSFGKFGEVKRMQYATLLEVMEHHRPFLENGFFYIMDAEVIKKHGLEDAYLKLLTEETIKRIISCNTQESIPLYEVANDTQRKVIEELIIQRIIDGEEIDLNIVAALSRIGQTDIIQKAENRKAKLAEQP